MWVKICGNTNLEDAARAVELGADAVGFVFAPSSRQVTVAHVAAMTPYLPDGVERVGVFDVRSAEEIAAMALEARLTTVQLHGALDEGLVVALAERFAGRVKIVQTLHWVVGDAGSAVRLAEEAWKVAGLATGSGPVNRVLLDSKVGAAEGGTGISFDWAGAREVLQAVPSGARLIVAGGLTPENVAGAIGQLQPWGVDVCSGVEAAPGRKDPARVAAFLASARGAEKP